ncbi:MAG: hydrogenase maturation protease [Acidobacteria bacterium]|nr:hydrogenase maturation protease [Acidobacteriota bacterium]
MLTIIGCGNLNRSDDGVGVVVCRRLLERADPAWEGRVAIHDAGTDGMGVMYKARGATALIVIDASRSGAEAGSVYEVPGAELERAPAASLNLHDFRWDNALFVGRKIFGDAFPTDVTVYLVEAAELGYGLELSPVVERAAETVLAAIHRRISAWLG